MDPRSKRPARHARVLLALAPAIWGCGGGGAPYTLDVGNDDAGGGGFQGGSGGDAGGGALSVSAGSDATVCAGGCVTLTARASGGRAPYRYQWDHGLVPTGSVRVCPTATTTYTVVAADSSGQAAGEVQSAGLTGSAHVTVSVAGTCADGGVADAGGPVGPGLQLQQPVNAPWTGITVGVREGGSVYWADWQTAGTGTLSGVLSPPSGTIDVTFTGADLYGAQTSSGSNYWTPAATYTSATVPSAPPGPGIIEINGGTMDSLAFSRPVINPLVAVVSLGTGYLGQTIALNFNAPCTVLSYGTDTWWPTGDGKLTASGSSVSAIEGSGVVEVAGTF
jgi:hypothetical protein